MIDTFGTELTDQIQSFGSNKKFDPNETLVYQGDQSRTIGFILEGRAKAMAYSENGDETWLGQFSTGEFFGHISYLTQEPINFEITAETELTAIMIPVSRLPDLMNRNSGLSRAMAENLAHRLSTMTTRLVEAITLSAPGRICSELMRLSKPVGIDPDKRVIRPNPVLVDVALRVGSTRETVSRTVNRLMKEGIASREPGAILIAQPEFLQDQIK